MTAQKMKHNPRLFLKRAMDIQRRQLLLAMADAVSECRTAEGMAAELLADVLAQVYACLILRPLHTPAGMGLYMELLYMMEALMLGEWFD